MEARIKQIAGLMLGLTGGLMGGTIARVFPEIDYSLSVVISLSIWVGLASVIIYLSAHISECIKESEEKILKHIWESLSEIPKMMDDYEKAKK